MSGEYVQGGMSASPRSRLISPHRDPLGAPRHLLKPSSDTASWLGRIAPLARTVGGDGSRPRWTSGRRTRGWLLVMLIQPVSHLLRYILHTSALEVYLCSCFQASFDILVSSYFWNRTSG